MQRWAKWFADRGHEVHLISSNYEDIEGIKIHLIGKKKEGSVTNFIRKMFQTRKLVWKIKPDILHAHYVFGYGTFAAFANYHPFVVSPWGSDIAVDPDKSLFHKLAISYTFKKADAVSAGDEVIKNRLIELKCNKDKIVPLRLATVNTNKFHPSKKSIQLRRSICKDNEFLVLYARQLKSNYKPEIFIQAIPFVLKKMSNVRFIILGNGKMKCQLKELAQKLNVEDKIVWGGKIPHSKMPEYLASADIYVDTFVNTSNNEVIDKGNGIGVLTLEAMSCATPQILPDRIEVTSGELYQGLIYRPLDYQDLADKIIELLQDEKLREQIGSRSRASAIKIVDENVIMRKWEKFYDRLYDKSDDREVKEDDNKSLIKRI